MTTPAAPAACAFAALRAKVSTPRSSNTIAPSASAPAKSALSPRPAKTSLPLASPLSLSPSGNALIGPPSPSIATEASLNGTRTSNSSMATT